MGDAAEEAYFGAVGHGGKVGEEDELGREGSGAHGDLNNRSWGICTLLCVPCGEFFYMTRYLLVYIRSGGDYDGLPRGQEEEFT